MLDRLGVPIEPVFDSPEGDEECCRPNLFSQVCRFTEASARGFQLMHMFLHELGHYHDRMTTRSKRFASARRRLRREVCQSLRRPNLATVS